MRKPFTIDFQELSNMSLSLNAYLALQTLIYGDLSYFIRDEDIEELNNGKWIESMRPSEKTFNYVNSKDLFVEFYNAFPFKVGNSVGGERPLRAKDTNTNAGKVTFSIWKNKTRGNIELQKHIINVLNAEVKYKENSGELMYMNNIDTWLRKHNWEIYEYLLDNTVKQSNIKRI